MARGKTQQEKADTVGSGLWNFFTKTQGLLQSTSIDQGGFSGGGCHKADVYSNFPYINWCCGDSVVLL